jgi:ubiquinone biosynthesis protein COQ9
MQQAEMKDALLDAALAHVPFDGWSETTYRAALADAGMDAAMGRLLCPKGGVDLALAYHRRGDDRMRVALAAEDLTALRFRDRVARAVRLRIEAADIELVRRGTTLFSLPQNALAGAGAIWGTADAIWTALGDQARDVNWYTKRATLSAVYGSTVLFWLGDDSQDQQGTWEFLDRRIGNVMEIEKMKSSVRENSVGKAVLAGPAKVLESLHAAKGRWRDMGRDAGRRHP